MHEYEIKDMYLDLEKYFSVKVSLDKKAKYFIILNFVNGLIDDFISDGPSENKIKNALKKILTENNNFYLIRLTRIALGSEEVKQDLRTGKNGIFEINYIKWKKIVYKVEQEELEAILSQGIEDI
jgi:hypothetical protein